MEIPSLYSIWKGLHICQEGAGMQGGGMIGL